MSSFIQGISGMLPMMLVLAFMYTVCMNIKTLVLEKELRLKEVLRAVGIQNGALWAASFTENFALLTIPCAFISVMVKVSGEGSPEGSDAKHRMGNDDTVVFIQGVATSSSGTTDSREATATCLGLKKLMLMLNNRL